MNYINFLASLYIGIAMIGCNAAQMGDIPVGKQQEISPRDQDQQSPRKITFLGKSINLRKAIANSSPRRTESPHRNSSRDDIEKSSGNLPKDNSPRDIESPRTKLQRSQSVILSQPEKYNKTLKDIQNLDKEGSPRGEGIVLTLLKKINSKSSPDVDEQKETKIFRNKSIDFTQSSYSSPQHLIIGEQERLSTNKHDDKKLPEPLSEEDKQLLLNGKIEVCSKWRGEFNKTLEQLVTNHEERLLAEQSKELQKQEEQA